jgi:crotonobetainyl-CoA:carnitine CoA-transferase CaiB-like acyl-CoA transferase
MAAPLDGIRVIEVSNWLAGPAAAALMADMGADVIKVEPPGGDVLRAFRLRTLGYDTDLDTVFQCDNRGKRSVTVDLERAGAPELVARLVERADVFITNLTQPRRERYRLTWEELRRSNPGLVYVSLTGYGTQGPEAWRAGFDYSAFWARSGIMSTLGEPPSPPPLCRGGQGDHTTALNLLAAALAALRVRDRTGESQYAEATLYGTGMWTIAGDLSAALVTGQQPPRHDRTAPPNPIWNSYETRDGRWILLVMPQPDAYWPRFCRALEQPDWEADPRYASAALRAQHGRELAAAISRRFAERDREDWGRRLDEHGIVWAPVATLPEVVRDAQARQIGAFRALEHPQHGRFETLAAPFAIHGCTIEPRGAAPAAGEHTRQVLHELGLGAREIQALADAGALG